MGLLSTIGSASGRAFGLTRVGAAIRDAYFNLTTLLLSGDGTNGAQNNTFLDSSSNNFTITRNGNTTQGTFSPFSQTGWSNYLNGSSSLDVASNAALALGTGDFTYEIWLCDTATQPAVASAAHVIGVNATGGCVLRVFDTGIDFNVYNVSSLITYSVTRNIGAWYHLAYSRSGTTGRLFYNGTLVGTATDSTNYTSSSNFIIGSNPTTGQFYTGYVSNARVVKGTALYTSSFTPSATPLTAVSGTSLLTCQSNRFVDNSSNGLAVTVRYSTPSVQAFSPFTPTAAYSAATNGGSGYFDGSGDYLGLPNNSAFTFNSDFTIESWIYISSYPSGDAFIATGNVPGSWGFSCNSSGQLSCDDRGSGYINSGATLLPKNAWTHVAWSHVGTTTSDALYINGIRVATGSGRSFSNTVTAPTVGSSSGGNFPFPGYISNLRILKGTALYSGASFTVPTSLLTNITNTSLLLNFTNAGITDATAKNDLETVGNAQISTTQSKFGGSSMYFDGTGDRLYIPDGKGYVNGTEPFTLECWVYLGGTPNYWTIFGSSSGSGLLFTVQNLTTIIVNPSGAGNTLSGTTSLTAGTWFHLALTRNSSNRFDIWVNGVSVGNATSSQSFGTPTHFVIGAADNSGGQQFNGYLDDVRISKFCRYTTTFTPPTAAFALQ